MKQAKALPILMYHHVSPAPGLVTVSPAVFRDHMQALARAGWRTAGLAEVEAFCRGEAVPAKTCVVTFDDGYLDNFIHAHPVLAEFGQTAVLFVVTGWLGDGPVRGTDVATPDHRTCKELIAAGRADEVMVRWSEVDAMAAAGTFEFHSHTHTHQRWDRLPGHVDERMERLAADLAASRETLVARLGLASRHLCWPQGYYDEHYLAVARRQGFDHLYTTQPGVNRPGMDTAFLRRFVTKERPGNWLLSRTGLYARPWLGHLYSKMH